MTDAERQIILAFAKGDTSKREEAIAIHRRYIPTLGVRGTPEQRFMAEVDNACPDVALRGQYRADLVVRRK